MSDLQQTADELAGKLHVLREQYAQSLYEAEVHPTPDTQAALKAVENPHQWCVSWYIPPTEYRHLSD